ncbi:hypothetical protein Tco_0104955 [Tanacetum coccineum]
MNILKTDRVFGMELELMLLMLSGINLLLLLKVNAARHKLTTAIEKDAEGVDCLPNATIFKQRTLMGSKTTAWNEFSSTMASAVTCLATNQKFNFSKYIFESMVKNLDNAGKILMYPRPRKSKRKDTQIPQSSGPTDNVADEAVNEEMDDSLERAATTATSLDAKQDIGNINKTQSKATPNEVSSQGTTSGGGPRHQETMGDTIAQTRFENVSKPSNDLLLARGITVQIGEDSLKLNELMKLCTNLQQRVLDLETTKTTQVNKIASLKRETRVESSGDEEDLDDAGMFDVNDLDGYEVIIDNVDVVKTAEETRSVVEEVTDVKVTLAQALTELKSAKPKAVKVVIQEPEHDTTTTTPTTIIYVPKPPQDKGKGIMIEKHVVQQVKPMKRLEQMRLDEELAFKLQAEDE